MRSYLSGTALAVAGMAGLFAAGAGAEVIATLGFTELSGSYDALDLDSSGNPLYRSVAVSEGSMSTRGDVTLLGGGKGTATFDTGYAEAGTADYTAAISVIGSGDVRPGLGSFTITDIDGDTITADIAGTWYPGPGDTGIIFFNGLLSNVRFTTDGNLIGDGTFDGTSGEGFDFSDLTDVYTGAFVQLSMLPGVGFFESNFVGVSTLLNANIVPSPGAALAMGLTALGLRRRR